MHKASKKKREKSSAKKERKATKTLAIVLGEYGGIFCLLGCFFHVNKLVVVACLLGCSCSLFTIHYKLWAPREFVCLSVRRKISSLSD